MNFDLIYHRILKAAATKHEHSGVFKKQTLIYRRCNQNNSLTKMLFPVLQNNIKNIVLQNLIKYLLLLNNQCLLKRFKNIK